MKFNSTNNFNTSYSPTSYYPYGELPLKYTKQGQTQLKKDLESGNTKAFETFNTPQPKPENKSNVTSQENLNNVKTSNNNFNGFSFNGDIDFNTVLPLLSNLGGNSSDMINKLMPLIKGDGNLQINDLLKIFTGLTKNKQSTATTESIECGTSIDELKRVD